MKKIKKIKIKLNGKLSGQIVNLNLSNYLKILKIPKEIAIELNEEIIDKNKLNKIKTLY